MSDRRVAIVDQGSNSTRLFLCEDIGPGGPVGERITTVTALRRGAAADGTVTAEALARVDACLADYARRVDAFVPDDVVVVGTSAVRDAPNREQIERLVLARLLVPLRTVSGAEEAELAYVGARLAVEGDGPVIVMDIGGGSTELVRGDAEGPRAAVSMDIGSVRHTELLLHHDPPTPQERAALVDEVRGTAAAVLEAIGADAPIVGVAGTITSLAAVSLGVYDAAMVHGLELSTARVAQITEVLGALPLAERRSVPGLHPDRAPAIVAGGCIAVGVLGAAGADHVTVSERDLLDGAVLRMTTMAG